ncbi:outer membrane protein OmpA-like peptidoglycan-associated protein [Janthinobacterium sp. CG_23.3]|uniref:OmpA family protein n=1 Tax=Janthinobacterium sp. CG_23.3 TaxID=3349634 RepID=UPI0038D3C8EC
MKQLNTSKIGKTLIAAIALALAVSGCADMSATQQGTATGAGVGAGLGALIGASTGGGGGKRAATGGAIGAAAGAIVGNIWSNKMENQRRTMEQATRGTGVQVSQTADNRLKMDIPSDVSFDTNRSDIKSNFRPILDRFAATLNENPASTVSIVGHTDSTGSDSINLPLSMDRASHTRDYLAQRGVSPTRVVVEGRGAREPVASNDDNASRARNRRVEIYVAEMAPR